MTSRYHIAASYVDVNDTSRGLLAASLCVVSSSISPHHHHQRRDTTNKDRTNTTEQFREA
jgi:hypothetical protein